MKRVLLVTDGSPNAARAAQTAAALADRGQGEVLIIYVVPPVPVLARRAVRRGGAELDDIVRALRDEMRAGHEALARAARVLRRAQVAHRAWLEQGTPAVLVDAIAREQECDAIVIGSAGLDRTTRLALGQPRLRSREHAARFVMIVT